MFHEVVLSPSLTAHSRINPRGTPIICYLFCGKTWKFSGKNRHFPTQHSIEKLTAPVRCNNQSFQGTGIYRGILWNHTEKSLASQAIYELLHVNMEWIVHPTRNTLFINILLPLPSDSQGARTFGGRSCMAVNKMLQDRFVGYLDVQSIRDCKAMLWKINSKLLGKLARYTICYITSNTATHKTVWPWWPIATQLCGVIMSSLTKLTSFDSDNVDMSNREARENRWVCKAV